MFRDCHAVLFVHCSLMVTCWKMANLFALLCVVFSCVFVTFPYGVLGQAWYLIVSIPDLCLLRYFEQHQKTWPVKEIYMCGCIVPVVCGPVVVHSLFTGAPIFLTVGVLRMTLILFCSTWCCY